MSVTRIVCPGGCGQMMAWCNCKHVTIADTPVPYWRDIEDDPDASYAHPLDCDPNAARDAARDTVTITIPRDTAEHMAKYDDWLDTDVRVVAAACRAVLGEDG